MEHLKNCLKSLHGLSLESTANRYELLLLSFVMRFDKAVIEFLMCEYKKKKKKVRKKSNLVLFVALVALINLAST